MGGPYNEGGLKKFFLKGMGLNREKTQVLLAYIQYKYISSLLFMHVHVCALRPFNGFFVVGSIPLRQLVYRVHPLPESMRPLVWDFGQLTDHTEELYTAQIVRRFMVTPIPRVRISKHYF